MKTYELFAQAACLDYEPDKFFPDDKDEQAIAEAKVICYNCPIIDACLEYALDNSLKYGVFGALTPAEREREQGIRWRQAYRDRQKAMA